MNHEYQNIIIISATSDIALSLFRKWKKEGRNIIGTYRNEKLIPIDLKDGITHFIPCDLYNPDSCDQAAAEILKEMPDWDVVAFATGTLHPIGKFLENDIDTWSGSILTNFTHQIRLTHQLLNGRINKTKVIPSVIYFAGSGTNGAADNYSAYTISKIALIKMCELLDEEIPEIKFSIIGPGWVKTRIHQETLLVGKEKAGDQYSRTLHKLNVNDGTPMSDVVAFVEWVIEQSKEIVGGRNFSVVYDDVKHPQFIETISNNKDMYKLRRAMNQSFVKSS